MNELKPCPFCGNTVLLRPLATQYCVMCTHCSAMIGYGTAKSVIALWNKRFYEEPAGELKSIPYADYVCVIDKYFKAVDDKMDLTGKYIGEQAKCINLNREIERLRAFNKALGHALDLSTSK